MNFISFMQMLGGAAGPQQMMGLLSNNGAVMGKPMARRAVELLQKGDMSGLNEMMNNLCKEKHTTPEQVQQQVMQMAQQSMRMFGR